MDRFARILVLIGLFLSSCLGSSLAAKRSRTKRSDDVSELTPVVAAQGQQLTELQAKMAALEASLTQQQQQLQLLHDKGALQIGFHARLSGNHNFQQGNTIKYDTVISNQGGSYNRTTGLFTAPSAGLYVFLVSSSSPDIIHSGSVYLSVDNHEVFYVDTTNKMTTGHCVVKLSQGQKVWVASNASNDLLQRLECTFSGFLVNQDW